MQRLVVYLVGFAAITVVTHGADQMSLEIQPNANNNEITKEIGGSLAITCKPNVPNPGLVNQLEWRDPRNNRIENTNPTSLLYVQKLVGDPGVVLIFPKLTESLAGAYTCSASYASTERLTATVTVKTIIDITFTDAPEHQYPILGQNYTIRCGVMGSPQPYIDWSRDSQQITTNDRYVTTTQGLLIKNVRESDDGTYVCSAVAIETGNVKSRAIKVEVQVRPEIEPMDEVRIIEGETATVKCLAKGKPPPTYTWIKESTKQDLSRTDRFDVQPNSGLLIVNRVEYNDHGFYTCSAKNSAGVADARVRINVLVKPRFDELNGLRNITTQIRQQANLVCEAYGRPPPEVTFRKRSNREPYQIGNNGEHISLHQQKFEDTGRTIANLTIYNVVRADDGLYECIAENEAGKSYKNGHVAVEFAPTFERTKDLPPVWTWDNRPANLTCLPEAIPNATIIWKLGNLILGDQPGLFKIFGTGVSSSLIVTPGNERRYFTRYECEARNKLGEASNFIELRQGFVPEVVQQVTFDSFTATTIKFKIVPPPNLRGLPLRSFTVQYKNERELSWENARNHTWSVDAPYILENLSPEVTYNFRFAGRNDVGMGQWAGDRSLTMPRRSVPAEPKIFLPNYSSDTIDRYGVAAVSPYADHFELRWNIPNDNGDPIDSFRIRYCVTKKIDGQWRDDEDTCSAEIMTSFSQTSYDLYNLDPDTVYKIELRAHNAIGLSSPAEIRVKTARGMDIVREEPAVISSGTIIGIVVAAIFIVLLLVDVICFCVARDGILARLCDRSKSKRHQEEDPKLGSYKAAPAHPSSLNLPLPIKLAPSPMEEKEPLRPGLEGQQNGDRTATTYVEYDRGQVFSKSGELIGKHSAV